MQLGPGEHDMHVRERGEGGFRGRVRRHAVVVKVRRVVLARDQGAATRQAYERPVVREEGELAQERKAPVEVQERQADLGALEQRERAQRRRGELEKARDVQHEVAVPMRLLHGPGLVVVGELEDERALVARVVRPFTERALWRIARVREEGQQQMIDGIWAASFGCLVHAGGGAGAGALEAADALEADEEVLHLGQAGQRQGIEPC